MAKIGLNISASGFSGKLLIRWLEASAPLAQVGRSDPFDFPYDDVYTINNINPVVHIVQLWRSDDGASLDQLIKSWEIDASLFNEISAVTYQYMVGRGDESSDLDEQWADPEPGDTELEDERLDGATKEELYVVEAGYGPKRDDEYDLRSGGGIVLLGGKQFDEDVSWFITHHRTITQSVPPGTATGTSKYAGVTVITEETDFYTDDSDNLYNNLVIVEGSAASVQFNFQALSLIPNGTHVTFNTHGGTQRYLKLQFNPGDTLKWLGRERNTIYVRRGADVSIFFEDGVGYITGTDPAAHRVGEMIWGRKGELNTVPLDGTQYTQAELEGLVEDYMDELPSADVVNETLWATSQLITYIANGDASVQEQKTVYPYKGLFARTDTGTPTIRVPDMRNMHVRALKYLDTTSDTQRIVNKPGGYQVDTFKSHTHKEALWNESGNSNLASGGNHNEGTYAVKAAGGTETRGENQGFIPLLII